jgi:hypothetical protein
VGGFVAAALGELQHEHPKVRYAALEVLGQAGEYVKPAFQEAYFDPLVPQLLKLLYDKTPRIVSHALACLSNFFLDFRQFWKVEAVVGELLTPLLHYLRSEDAYLQQCALEVVSCLAGIRHGLGGSVGVVVAACGELLQKSLQAKSKDMMEEVFESLSTLLTQQRQSAVGVYIPQFVESLLLNHSGISEESFFECWSKLCLSYKAFLDLQSSNVVALLLEKAERVAGQKIEEMTLLSLEALGHTFAAFQFALRPYVMQIYSFCKRIL